MGNLAQCIAADEVDDQVDAVDAYLLDPGCKVWPIGNQGGAGRVHDVLFGCAAGSQHVELVNRADLRGHQPNASADADDQHRLARVELDLVGDVVGGGPCHGDGGGVGEGDLLGLGHGGLGCDERVLCEATIVTCNGTEHLVADAETFDALSQGGHHTGDLEPHGDWWGLRAAEVAGADLPVGWVHPGGTDGNE